MIPDGLAFPTDMVQGKPNCGLVAISVACGVTLDEATRAYMKVDNRNRDGRWKGATRWHITVKTISFLGTDYTVLDRPRCNLYNFLKNGMRRDALYVIRVRGHVMTAKNGWIFDQAGATSANRSMRVMRQHVKNVIQIT